MVRITFEISTDNAAFDDDPEAEIRRIVNAWLEAWNRTQTSLGAPVVLRDWNGNATGRVIVER